MDMDTHVDSGDSTEQNVTIPIDEIYKVFRYDSTGSIFKVYVFSGGLKNESHMSELFKEDQLKYISDNNVEVYFSTIQIHKDDSVRVLKKKIINEVGAQEISYDEIYLFGFVMEIMNADNIFHDITKNDTIPISGKAFAQLAENLGIDTRIISPLVKESYTYEDLLQFDIGSTSASDKRLIKTCIGRRFINKRNPLFSANPFKLSSQIFSLTVDEQFVNFENQLIFNFGDIVNKEIYLCPAKDVFTYFAENDNGIEETYLTSLYYPFLEDRGIYDIEKLELNRESLLAENRTIVSKFNLQYYRSIDIFHQIYYNRTTDIPYIYRGIKTLSIVIHGNRGKNIPLESIFKSLHASPVVLLMVFNPGTRKDNLVRLYSEKISKNGKKVPVLNEPTVMRLMREIPKNNMITALFRIHGYDLIIGIDEYGAIHVSSETLNPVNIQDWDLIIKDVLNPFITSTNNIIAQAGYMIPDFVGLRESNVDIIDIVYSVSLRITKDMSIKKRIPCILSIFDVNEDKLSIASLKFKRVANFREMNSIYATITRLYNEMLDPQNIISELKSEFGLSEEDAINNYEIYLNENQKIHGRLVDNPGFPIIFEVSPIDKTLSAKVSGIIDINYIDTLDVYLDTIFRMTQYPESSRISRKVFSDACLPPSRMGKDIDFMGKKNVVGDIKSPTETESTVLELPEIQPIGVGNMEEDSVEPEGFMFDDYDYEDEEEDSSEDKIEEGNDNPSPVEKNNVEKSYDSPTEKEDLNLDGMRIGNPSYFFTRMKEREPVLVLSKKEGKYDAYARACPANIDRQPVILTPAEKEEIDKNHPGSYNNALKYGSDPNNPNWYICPRYWCLKTNTSMTQAEVDTGVCGGIIPKGSSIIPPGKYVYEFTSKNHVDPDGNYLEQTPGFLGKNKHPTHCLPCCFSREWDSKSQSDRRKECGYEDEYKDVPREDIVSKKKSDKNMSYVISVDIFPIQKKRWGFLPTSAQKFLQVDYDSITYNMHYINRDSPCLLRYGVEQTNTNTQSFIGCLANFYAFSQGLDDIPSVVDMVEILVEAISLDRFIRYHNGSLVAIFRPKEINVEDIDVTKYSDSVFYASIDMDHETQVDFLENTVASYENFLGFIRNSGEVVDHTYLWDAISDDNPKMIPGGANLVIMNVPNDDMTDNIEILCPTNSYSSSKFLPSRQSFIVIKQDTFYEPIYLYNDSTTEGFKVTKSFSKQSVPNSISRILEVISSTTNKYCAPLSSRPMGVFPFSKNLSAITVVEIALKYGYEIETQVMNYQSKIIGLMVVVIRTNSDSDTANASSIQERIFIPCLPSSMIQSLNIKYMDDASLWQKYRTTLRLLREVKRHTGGKILCSPKIKVVSDGMVVGLLTETNQFIQLSPPETLEDTLNDGLRSFSSSNYIIADTAILTGKNKDTVRETEVKKILLESQFYMAFRALVRQVMNKYENRELRRNILKTISDRDMNYKDKLRGIIKIIRTMVSSHVVFQSVDIDVVLSFGNITGCENDSCGDNSKKYCLAKQTGKSKTCVLIIPDKHILSGLDNERVYYGRMADELVRYRRIQLFMFKPRFYLNISNTQYSVNASEILILQSSITHEYFKDSTVFNVNSRIHNVDYENAEPSISQKYSMDVGLSEQNKMVEVIEHVSEKIKEVDHYINNCIAEIRDVVGNRKNSIWAQSFPSSTKEIFFKPTNECGFGPIIYIIQTHTKSRITVETVKGYLCHAYGAYMDKYKYKIAKIFTIQGKRDFSQKLKTGTSSIESIINSDDYYITDLDLWMVFDYLKIPVILFYSTKSKTFIMNVNWIFLGGNNPGSIYDNIYFIRSPARIEINYPYEYHVITPSFKYRELGDLSIEIQKSIDDIQDENDNIQSLATFLKRFVTIKITGNPH